MRIEGVLFLFSLSLSLLACPVYAQCEGSRCNGDNNGDGEVNISELIQSVNVALGGCDEDTCQVPFPLMGGLLATGQRTSYGPGSDGDVQAGAALSYTDNGDGTITDNVTGLMWEKKDDAGGIHDKDNAYTWGMPSEPYTMNGTMVTVFLAALNTEPCFAGYCDWRIPNYKELTSILHLEQYLPPVDPAFNTGCAPGCTVDGVGGPICSCAPSFCYWSSTTSANGPDFAWGVYFDLGYVGLVTKDFPSYVRAVRGGS